MPRFLGFFVVDAQSPASPGMSWLIIISRPDLNWLAVASFPYEMRDEAYRRWNDLRNEQDLEDLLREWGDEDDYERFLELRTR